MSASCVPGGGFEPPKDAGPKPAAYTNSATRARCNIRAMRVSWIVEGRGGDYATVDTAEEASRALTAAVRTLYEDLPTGMLANCLGPVMGLRALLVTEGAAAVARGDEWSARAGNILVSLSPS